MVIAGRNPEHARGFQRHAQYAMFHNVDQRLPGSTPGWVPGAAASAEGSLQSARPHNAQAPELASCRPRAFRPLVQSSDATPVAGRSGAFPDCAVRRLKLSRSTETALWKVARHWSEVPIWEMSRLTAHAHLARSAPASNRVARSPSALPPWSRIAISSARHRNPEDGDFEGGNMIGVSARLIWKYRIVGRLHLGITADSGKAGFQRIEGIAIRHPLWAS